MLVIQILEHQWSLSFTELLSEKLAVEAVVWNPTTHTEIVIATTFFGHGLHFFLPSQKTLNTEMQYKTLK